MVRIREEPITVYEKKIHGEELTRWVFGNDYLDIMYSKYVENLIKNTSVLPSGDVDKLRSEWENISKKIFSTFRGETFTTFSQRAK